MDTDNEIIFITPSELYKEKFNDMRNESLAIGENTFLYGLDDIGKYEKLKQYPEYIPISVYWILKKKTDELLGVITIRHRLRDENDKNGHVSLIIRPKERRKGYGTVATKFAIDKCKELGIKTPIIETQEENIGAIKILENTDFEKIQNYDEFGYEKRTYRTK